MAKHMKYRGGSRPGDIGLTWAAGGYKQMKDTV